MYNLSDLLCISCRVTTRPSIRLPFSKVMYYVLLSGECWAVATTSANVLNCPCCRRSKAFVEVIPLYYVYNKIMIQVKILIHMNLLFISYGRGQRLAKWLAAQLHSRKVVDSRLAADVHLCRRNEQTDLDPRASVETRRLVLSKIVLDGCALDSL